MAPSPSYSAAMATTAADHTGSPIAWREVGSGPPVVFLHGLGGTRTAWGPQLRALHERFRCIAWDMPGYGDSDLVVPLTYRVIADRLIWLLDKLDIEKADLVGLSFGGMHAIHTAIHHPQRVNRLVLADSSPAFGMDGTTKEDWIASRLGPIDAGHIPGEAAEKIIDAITATQLTGRIREETITAFGEIPADGFRAAVNCLPTNDVRAELGSIEHQTCVIVGELDEETPVSYARVLADGLPNAQFHIIDGAGHLTPSEAPDRFNQLVSEFLTAVPGPEQYSRNDS